MSDATLGPLALHGLIGRTGTAADAEYVFEVVEDGPTAYWRMEETSGSTVVDVGPQDGTVSGADLDIDGVVGSAVSFDGTDDYIEVANDASLSGWDDFTIELWARNLPDTSSQYLIAVYSTDGDERSWGIFTSGGGVSLNLSNDGSSFSTTLSIGREPVDDADWHHIVFTRSGSDLRAYLDGSQVDTGTFSGTLYAASAPLRIGARSDPTPTGHIAAEIDEVALYDQALSAARIQAHYDAAG